MSTTVSKSTPSKRKKSDVESLYDSADDNDSPTGHSRRQKRRNVLEEEDDPQEKAVVDQVIPKLTPRKRTIQESSESSFQQHTRKEKDVETQKRCRKTPNSEEASNEEHPLIVSPDCQKAYSTQKKVPTARGRRLHFDPRAHRKSPHPPGANGKSKGTTASEKESVRKDLSSALLKLDQQPSKLRNPAELLTLTSQKLRAKVAAKKRLSKSQNQKKLVSFDDSKRQPEVNIESDVAVATSGSAGPRESDKEMKQTGDNDTEVETLLSGRKMGVQKMSGKLAYNALFRPPREDTESHEAKASKQVDIMASETPNMHQTSSNRRTWLPQFSLQTLSTTTEENKPQSRVVGEKISRRLQNARAIFTSTTIQEDEIPTSFDQQKKDTGVSIRKGENEPSMSGHGERKRNYFIPGFVKTSKVIVLGTIIIFASMMIGPICLYHFKGEPRLGISRAMRNESIGRIFAFGGARDALLEAIPNLITQSKTPEVKSEEIKTDTGKDGQMLTTEAGSYSPHRTARVEKKVGFLRGEKDDVVHDNIHSTDAGAAGTNIDDESKTDERKASFWEKAKETKFAQDIASAVAKAVVEKQRAFRPRQAVEEKNSKLNAGDEIMINERKYSLSEKAKEVFFANTFAQDIASVVAKAVVQEPSLEPGTKSSTAKHPFYSRKAAEEKNSKVPGTADVVAPKTKEITKSLSVEKPPKPEPGSIKIDATTDQYKASLNDLGNKLSSTLKSTKRMVSIKEMIQISKKRTTTRQGEPKTDEITKDPSAEKPPKPEPGSIKIDATSDENKASSLTGLRNKLSSTLKNTKRMVSIIEMIQISKKRTTTRQGEPKTKEITKDPSTEKPPKPEPGSIKIDATSDENKASSLTGLRNKLSSTLKNTKRMVSIKEMIQISKKRTTASQGEPKTKEITKDPSTEKPPKPEPGSIKIDATSDENKASSLTGLRNKLSSTLKNAKHLVSIKEMIQTIKKRTTARQSEEKKPSKNIGNMLTHFQKSRNANRTKIFSNAFGIISRASVVVFELPKKILKYLFLGFLVFLPGFDEPKPPFLLGS